MPRVASAVWLDPTTKATLDRLVRSPSTRHGLVQRCRIVLAAAAGQTNQQIAGDLQMPEVTVSKWRRGFASQGLEGLQDAPRSGRPVKQGPEIVQRVQNRVCQQPERTYNPIGFAPLLSARILILKPNCWIWSAYI